MFLVNDFIIKSYWVGCLADALTFSPATSLFIFYILVLNQLLFIFMLVSFN